MSAVQGHAQRKVSDSCAPLLLRSNPEVQEQLNKFKQGAEDLQKQCAPVSNHQGLPEAAWRMACLLRLTRLQPQRHRQGSMRNAIL